MAQVMESSLGQAGFRQLARKSFVMAVPSRPVPIGVVNTKPVSIIEARPLVAQTARWYTLGRRSQDVTTFLSKMPRVRL
jgi:hypothetical protein